MKKRLLAYLAPFIWMTLIYILSSQPVLPGPDVFWQDFIMKKVAHMTVYAVLYFLWFNAWNIGRKKPDYIFPFVMSLAYAATDEIHQKFVPGRTATLRDIGYDFIGMSITFFRLKQWI